MPPSRPSARTRTSPSRRPNNRQRGKRGEREAVHAVREHWASRTAIRAAQANGKFSADVLHADRGDRLHVEVKLRRRLSVMAFVEQASRDADPLRKIPVVLMREDHGEWLVMVRIADTKGFVDALHEQLRSA